MLNFGASKPRVGGLGPRGPPWIRTCPAPADVWTKPSQLLVILKFVNAFKD